MDHAYITLQEAAKLKQKHYDTIYKYVKKCATSDDPSIRAWVKRKEGNSGQWLIHVDALSHQFPTAGQGSDPLPGGEVAELQEKISRLEQEKLDSLVADNERLQTELAEEKKFGKEALALMRSMERFYRNALPEGKADSSDREGSGPSREETPPSKEGENKSDASKSATQTEGMADTFRSTDGSEVPANQIETPKEGSLESPESTTEAGQGSGTNVLNADEPQPKKRGWMMKLFMGEQ